MGDSSFEVLENAAPTVQKLTSAVKKFLISLNLPLFVGGHSDQNTDKCQIPPDVVVKSQAVDITEII
jgi:hypothetical protein